MTQTDKPALDPFIADLDCRMLESGLQPMYRGTDGAEMRRRSVALRADFYPKPELSIGSVEDDIIPDPAGDIRMQIFRPHAPTDATIVYFHGGGWIVGDLDSHFAHAARIAEKAGAVVVNVDYRLAPEHPFPAGAEDALAATRWVLSHIAQFGGNAAKFAVAGDSAGGNLAAVAAIACRDERRPLAAQLLIYPVTDLTQSGGDVAHHYFGGEHAGRSRDWRASPRHAPSLAGLAPAIIGVGAHDFLYEDNVAYVAALHDSGTEVCLREYPTLNHSFFSYTGISKLCEAAADQLCEDLRGRLHVSRTG